MTISRPRLFSLALCTFALAACTVGPDYVRPAAPAPVAYKELPAGKPAQPADTAPRGDWWEVYDDPELNALKEQVDRREPDARAGRGARTGRPAPPCASRAPSSSPVVGRRTRAAPARRAANSRGGGTGERVQRQRRTSTWEVDLWGGIRRSVEASESGAQASGGRPRERAAVAAGGARAELLPAARRRTRRSSAAPGHGRRVRALAAAHAEPLRRRRRRARRRRAGRDAAADRRRRSLIDVANTRAQLEHAIAVLVGKPPADFSLAERTDVPPVPDVPLGVPSELLERRPDIAAAERRVAAAQRADRRRAGGVLSRRSRCRRLAASSSSSVGNLVSLPSRFWSLGASLAQNDLRRRPARGAARRRRSPSTTQPVAQLSPDGARRVPGSRGQPRRAAHPRSRRPPCRPRRCARHASRSR